ncbi:hypothetical protein VPHK394_0037 [Vibrio phage K394]
MENNWIKQNAIAMAIAAVSVTSSFVITQQATGDNTRRIVNLEKYTRVKSDELKRVELDVAVLKEQQKTNAINNADISNLLEQTTIELKSTRLAVERLSAKVDG